MEGILYYCTAMYFLSIVLYWTHEDKDKTLNLSEWLLILFAPITIPGAIVWVFILAMFD